MDLLAYYTEPTELTNISKHKDFIDKLPSNPELICQIVQGLLVHGVWAKFYGFEADIDKECYGYAKMSDLLDKIIELDSRALSIARMPENRAIVCCRDFATLSCAIMRYKGIAARSRCGFATYMGWEGTIGDHWVVEYWNGKRWVMNDPQTDPFQVGTMEKWGFNKVQLSGKIIDTKHTNYHEIGRAHV